MSQETVLVLGDGEITLGEYFRLVTPSGPDLEADALAESLVERPVHVLAQGAASAAGCWLAVRRPEVVQRLVLARPGCLNEDLVARLGEIQAETLVVLDSSAPPDAGDMYQQRIPRAYRFFVYAPGRFASLIADFLRRGETFIVNTGETRSW